MTKISIFWQKLWPNPIGKFRFFFCFFKTSFFWSKKDLFIHNNKKKRSSLSWFAQKTQTIKRSIFLQNHRLTPLENFDFLYFFKTFFFWSKKDSFLSRTPKNNLFLLDLPPKKHSTWWKARFLTKSMDKPLWKISIYWSFLKLPFSGLKSILFYPEDQKTIFVAWFAQKNTDDKEFEKLKKTMI